MNCTNCETENPAGAAFCMKCGTKLGAPPCTKCGADIPEGAAFCMKCGTPVGDAASAAAPASAPAPAQEAVEQYIPRELLNKLQAARKSGGMQGERRTVTILFCDVQGSTAAAEQLDPEEWAEIMNGAFEHLIAPVYRYEGMLARLMGDAILAFFGAPISHEDDPERAALAGLAIVNEIGPYQKRVKAKWGIDVNVRVGINTGLVVVGEVGSDMRLEYTAMGDAVNLASRMESTAQPGTVQVSEDTHKLIAPLFESESLGAVEVKGKREPVNTWRLLRKKLKPGRLRGIEGLDSPMIGRDRELGGARSQLEQLTRGTGQAMGVLGEAGLGKSRLLAELKAAAKRDGLLDEIGWLEARALSYETGAPYAPFTRMMREHFGLDTAQGEERYAAVASGVAEVAPHRVGLIAPYLAHALGVDVPEENNAAVAYLSPPDLRAKVDGAIIDWIESLAEQRPLVLVLEDMHWSDPASLDVSKALLEVTDRASLMLIGLLRPRRSEGAWSFHELASRDFAHRYSSHQLAPLDDDAGRALIENLLHIEGMTDELRDLILSRADGNPLYVEELIRTLIDRGELVEEEDGFVLRSEVEKIAVPETLQGVLNARLDQLDETTRRVAQTAAVLGRELAFDTLASVYEPLADVNKGISELMRRGLVREVARLPARKLAFKHVLMRDAAYESLLLKTRRELHKSTAEVLLKIAPDDAALIAHHYVSARERDLALPHLLTAGDRAAAAYANEDAKSLLGQAVDIAVELEDSDLARRAFEALGEVYKLTGEADEALKHFDRMLEFATKHGDGSMQASAHNKRGFVYLMMFADVDKGDAELHKGMEVAEAAECKIGQAEASMIQCAVCTSQARFDDAYSYLDKAVQLGRDLDAVEPKLYGMTHIANTLVYMTEMDRARDQVLAALELAKEEGNLKYVAELKAFSLPFVLASERKIDEAVAAVDEGFDLAVRIGGAAAEAQAAWIRATLAILRGEYELALRMNEAAAAAGRRGHIPWLEATATCSLGTTYLQMSQALARRASEYHDKAEALMNNPFGDVMAATNHCEIGFCALTVGKVDLALSLFEGALTAQSPMVFICEPHLLVGIALVHLQRGDTDKAQSYVERARDSMAERKLQQYGPIVDHTSGVVAAALSRPEDALASFLRGLEDATELGFLPFVIDNASGAARLYDAAGDEAAALAARERGRAAMQTIADRFADDELKNTFLEGANAKLAPATA
jgi:class 3 adenylate cyclase/tetratricopeptide (TPR) repeat protein